jgi:hypothetical protein
MDFWAVLRVPVRRWYVVVPLGLLAVFAAAAAYLSGPLIYTSEASVVLAAPSTGGTDYANGFVPVPRNPLLLQDQGVRLAAAVLAQAMRTEEFTQRLALPDGSRATLTVSNGSDATRQLVSNPLVRIVAQSDSPDEAQALLQRTVVEAREELRLQQVRFGAPLGTFITAVEIVAPTEPVAGRGTGARTAAVIVGMGLLGSVIVAFIAESVLQARGRRRLDRTVTATSTSAV